MRHKGLPMVVGPDDGLRVDVHAFGYRWKTHAQGTQLLYLFRNYLIYWYSYFRFYDNLEGDFGCGSNWLQSGPPLVISYKN